MILLLKSSIQKLYFLSYVKFNNIRLNYIFEISCFKKKIHKIEKTIFSSYLRFHNIKQEMNLEEVNRTVSKRKPKNQCKKLYF